MKTIPVSLIVAGILIPAISRAQPEGGPGGPPERQGQGRREGQKRPFVEFWKSLDKDQDGSLSKAEFDAMPRLQNLPEEKRANLFQRLDKNADGKLAREELGRMGKPHDGQQGPPMPRLWELDVDKSGGVSFDEFKNGELFKKLPPEKLDSLFKRLDTNGDGVVSPKDKPEPPFKRDGDRQRPKRAEGGKPGGPPREPRQIIRQLDTNGDGALTFEEFRVGPGVKHLGEDEQEDRFEEMDKNHDHKLTPEDFPPPPCDEPGGPDGNPPPKPKP